MKTGRVYLGSQFKMQSFMVGKSRQQGREAAGFVTFTPKAENEMNFSAQISHSTPIRSRTLPREWHRPEWEGLHTSLHPSEIISHKPLLTSPR